MTDSDDSLIKKTADSITVDVFDLANQNEKNEPSMQYKPSIKIHAAEPKPEETKNTTIQAAVQAPENELTHGSQEFNEIKSNQSELFDFMDSLHEYAKKMQAKIDTEDESE